MATSSVPRIFFLGCTLAAGFAVPACQTSRLEDIAPLAGVRNTGTTPDLNVAQKAETAQLSEAEKDVKTAQLRAALASQRVAGQGPATRTSPAQLRKAAREQAQTLKEIEGE